MLGFFKLLRQRVFNESKFGKYIIYALGEIILIVVGILLALQINVWNQNRKNRKMELRALKDLQSEFQVNHSKLTFIYDKAKESMGNMYTYYELINESEFFKSDQFTLDYVRENRDGPGGLKTFNPQNGVLRSLISTGQINLIENESLKYLLVGWEDMAQDFTENNEGYLEWWNNSYSAYMETLPPLKPDYSQISGSEDELLTRYRNMFLDYRYWLLIERAYFSLNQKVEGAQNMLEQVNTILSLIEKEIAIHK